jgi:hypothetical protein
MAGVKIPAIPQWNFHYSEYTKMPDGIVNFMITVFHFMITVFRLHIVEKIVVSN